MVDVVHICVAMKPLDGNFAQNALEHGVAGLNVDACRIATSDEDAKAMGRCNTPGSGRMYAAAPPIGTFIRSSSSGALDTTRGRWPANVMFQHHPECVLKGMKKVKGITGGNKPGSTGAFGKQGIYGKANGLEDKKEYADKDGNEEVESWECHEDCPVRQLDEQSGITTPSFRKSRTTDPDGLWSLKRTDGRPKGFSDLGGASRFFKVIG